MTVSGATEPVTVHGQPAQYQATLKPAQIDETHTVLLGEVTVFWPYGTESRASVSCAPGPKGLGTARTPEQIKQLVLQLADTVTFGQYAIKVPIRIGQLPTGYHVDSARQDELSPPTDWDITLAPDRPSPTTPAIVIAPLRGTVPAPNTHVGNYPAAFFVDMRAGGKPGAPQVELSRSSLCVPTAPIGNCLSSGNTPTDDPESRRPLLHNLAEQLTYASSPTDTTTWFDAADALPS